MRREAARFLNDAEGFILARLKRSLSGPVARDEKRRGACASHADTGMKPLLLARRHVLRPSRLAGCYRSRWPLL